MLLHWQNFLYVSLQELLWNAHPRVPENWWRGVSLEALGYKLPAKGQREEADPWIFRSVCRLTPLWVLKLLGTEEAMCAQEELGAGKGACCRSLQAQHTGTKKQKTMVLCSVSLMPSADRVQHGANLAKEKTLKGPYTFSQSKQKVWLDSKHGATHRLKWCQQDLLFSISQDCFPLGWLHCSLSPCCGMMNSAAERFLFLAIVTKSHYWVSLTLINLISSHAIPKSMWLRDVIFVLTSSGVMPPYLCPH